MRVELAGLAIADSPARWGALGFAVDDRDQVGLLGCELALGSSTPPARGITGWTLRHASSGADIDGLPTAVTTDAPRAAGWVHPAGFPSSRSHDHGAGGGARGARDAVLGADDRRLRPGALGPDVGEPRTAVQPGRQIATVLPSAGLSTRLACMDLE